MELTKQPAQAAVRWLNTAQAATYTGFSRHYIRDAANSGRLKGYRSGGNPRGSHWRFLAEDLDRFVTTAALGPRTARSA